MANDITTNEYQQYVALREQIIKGLEEADSEFMLTTYSMLHSVMNKRQKAAMQVNLRVENAAIREKKEQKREALRKASEQKKNAPQRPTQSTPRT
jgi:long-subunit acyl-CoA synthetase (AMP-forming)